MKPAGWLSLRGEEATLTVHVQPGARTTGTAGLHGDALKVRLAAPPVDGKANACLLEFLARQLAVPRARLELVSGHASRRKSVRVTGADSALVERLARLASSG